MHPNEYPNKAVRKLCKVLAAELGMTKADLPKLQTKLEVFQSSFGGANEGPRS